MPIHHPESIHWLCANGSTSISTPRGQGVEVESWEQVTFDDNAGKCLDSNKENGKIVVLWDFMGFNGILWDVPSGKRFHNYGKSPFWMGKFTISMTTLNNYVTNYQE